MASPEHGEEDVTLDGPSSPSSLPSYDAGLAADRRIEVPVNLPAVKRRRTRGAGWFVVAFVLTVSVVLVVDLLLRG